MRPLTVDELKSLLEHRDGPCVSLLMPTHRRPPGTREDPVRFRNLLTRAEGLLAARAGAREVEALLAPVRALAAPEFWRDQAEGLAVFRSPRLTVHYRLPLALPELAVVADSFHVKPLLRFLQTNRHYHLLVLSQGRVRFFAGGLAGLVPADVPGLPASRAEALGEERTEPFVTAHPASSGATSVVFHGHGGAGETHRADLVRFFRAVDEALWEVLREERAPLVLAGVGYLLPIYRQVTRYAHLAPGAAEGNFDAASPEELHRVAWPIAREVFLAEEAAALAEFHAQRGAGLAVEGVEAIAAAALEARVRLLLVADEAHVWGRLDRETGRVRRHPEQRDAYDDDLLDDLSEIVLARGGDVLVLPPARMPSASPAAAVLRWQTGG